MNNKGKKWIQKSVVYILVLVMSLFYYAPMEVEAASSDARCTVSRTVSSDSITLDTSTMVGDVVRIDYSIDFSDQGSHPELGMIIFEEQFSSDFDIVGTSTSDISVDEDTKIIRYNPTMQYTSEGPSLNFSVTIQPNSLGTGLDIDASSSAVLQYEHDKNTKNGTNYTTYLLTFPSITIDVTESPDFVYTANKNIEILELQPGTNQLTSFELDESDLEAAFGSGYSVNIDKLPITEFNGKTDKINGKYDIIYIGNKESYSVDFKGKNRSVNIDVDLTNLKLDQLLDYAGMGQLLIIDSGVFADAGTNMKARLASSTAYSISNIGGQAGEVVTRYNNSEKRPILSITTQPTAYDGTSASFSDYHSMNFVFSTSNEDDDAMEINLYGDANGDGLFDTVKEKVIVTQTIPATTENRFLNTTIPSSFNGVLPWKMELVNTVTGVKSYELGYAAFNGDKTEVDVLQLTPANNYLDLSTSAFKVTKSTTQYNINITSLNIDTWNSNYPNSVTVGGEAVETILNGNYDMVILGFQDSYRNDDIYLPGVDNDLRIAELKEFIATGQSVMFTHDTLGPDKPADIDLYKTDFKYKSDFKGYNDAPNISRNFWEEVGFQGGTDYTDPDYEADKEYLVGRSDGINKLWIDGQASDRAYKINEGLITMYPYMLETNLKIAKTHEQYWKIDLEDEDVIPWYTLTASNSSSGGNLQYNPENYFYTFSKGNVTFSGTGHSSPAVSDGSRIPEQELFLNTIMKAARSANHAPTFEVYNIYSGMNVDPSQTELNFKLQIHDVNFEDIEFERTITFLKQSGGSWTELSNPQVVTGLEKEVLLSVDLPKNAGITSSDAEFGIRISVKDARGAESVEEFSLTHLSEPGVTITNDVLSGYLIGDVIDITYLVSPINTGDDTRLSNIDASFTIDDASIASVSAMPGLTGLSFDASQTITKEIELVASASGSTGILFELDYDIDFGSNPSRSKQSSASINVRNSTLNIEVKDNTLRGLTGIECQIYKDDGSTLPIDTIYTNNGTAVKSNLPSGNYKVKVISRSPFADAPEQTFTLSYNNNQETLAFELEILKLDLDIR